MEQHHLLLSTVPPHKLVVTSTISGWLKHFMAEAGLDTTKCQVHSVRSASTLRETAGLSAAVIMEKYIYIKMPTGGMPRLSSGLMIDQCLELQSRSGQLFANSFEHAIVISTGVPDIKLETL